MELSEHPTVAPHGDYFRSLARSRADQDAEPPAWDLAELREFLRRGTLRPSTADELFEVVMDRLAGAAHSLEEGDFSCRDLLAPKGHERLVQKYLAYVLHLTSREHYSVAREEEVFLGKMPDIRLHGNFGDPHPVISIEIKIADNWPTMASLEAALRDQLVGQYLRDTRSRHGILVLLRKARMSWTDDGNGSLSFAAVCERLANQAAALSGGGLTVRVVSIDLCREGETAAQQEPASAPRASRRSGAGERRKRRPSTRAVGSEAPTSG